jgi:hypothetical protein
VLSIVLINPIELMTFFTDYGDVSAVSELQLALQEYLAVVLGLTMKGFIFFLFPFVFCISAGYLRAYIEIVPDLNREPS